MSWTNTQAVFFSLKADSAQRDITVALQNAVLMCAR
jgi:hypothetical protein